MRKREFVFRFTQKWWMLNHGLDFGHRYYVDAMWRVARHQEMQDILQRLLPDVPSRCFALLPAGVGLSLGAYFLVLGICGSQIHYADGQDPWAETPLLRNEEDIECFEPPDLEESAFMAEQVAQFDCLAREYSPSEIDAYGQGSTAVFSSTLVTGYKLAGEGIFALMYQRPKLVHSFFRKLAVLNEAIIDFWARKRNVQIDDIFIGDCVATLLSPQLYHQFSLPYNDYIVRRRKWTWGIHSCGPSTHVVQDLVRPPDPAWCEVGWYAESGNTDLTKAREALIRAGCPQIGVLLGAGEVLRWDEQELEHHIGHIVEATEPLDLVVRVILEEGITLDKVRALCEAVEV